MVHKMCKISIFLLIVLSVSTNCLEVEDQDYGGYDASISQFPWYAHIEAHFGSSIYYRGCGGSIISPDYVLTAGYCGEDEDVTSFYLYFGKINFQAIADPLEAIISYVFIPHPFYGSPHSMANNIGLIRSPTPIQFSVSVQAITLPWIDVDETSVHTFYVGARPNGSVHEMKWHFLQAITDEECSSPIITDETTLCTMGPSYNENHKPCYLHHGGVLAYFVNSTWIQLGVSSLAPPCQSGISGVFTRVSSFTNWISAVTGIDFQ